MKYIGPFAAVLYGEERRTFTEAAGVPIAPTPLTNHEIGIKGGVQVQIGRWFMVAPAVGTSIRTPNRHNVFYDDADLFLDFEINHTMGGAFIGTGYSWWALTDDKRDTDAILLQFGVPIIRHEDGRGRLLFTGEGRYFLEDHNFKNNYQYWGGFRWVFR
jgi:hypothetical protein